MQSSYKKMLRLDFLTRFFDNKQVMVISHVRNKTNKRKNL